MRFRMLAFCLITMLLISACNLGREDENDLEDLPTSTTQPSGRPTITINSPENGAEVLVDDPILISATATDSAGVTSVQLRVNGQVVRTVASEAVGGDISKSVLLDYTPRTEGQISLELVAFRGSVPSEPASLSLTVRRTQSQVTATAQQGGNVPIIDPNDPTCRALVNTGLNFRRGPGTSFDIIRVLGSGEVLPIIGRLGDNSWWQLSSRSAIGWVDARFVTTYGNCTGIPTVSAPVTSTPAPTATNTSVATVTSTSTPQNTATPLPPDLTVTNISGPNSVTIPAGQTSVTETYSVNITNQGGVVNVQFSNEARILPSGGTFDVGVVANLNTNQSITLTFQVTFNTPGTFALQVAADSENQITESSEGNNTGLFTVTVEQAE